MFVGAFRIIAIRMGTAGRIAVPSVTYSTKRTQHVYYPNSMEPKSATSTIAREVNRLSAAGKSLVIV